MAVNDYYLLLAVRIVYSTENLITKHKIERIDLIQ